MTPRVLGQPRIVDLAEQAGLEYPELRAFLVREVDRAVRGRTPEEISERDRQLFADDPGFIGFGSRGSQTVSVRQSWPSRNGSSDYTSRCPNGHEYGPEDRDKRGRRRCSRCTSTRSA